MFTAGLLLAMLSVSSPSGLSEEARWARMERGQTREQVGKIIGMPMLRNAARGYELWIYDDGGCAQFHGGVLVAWTKPAALSRPAVQPAPPPPAPTAVSQRAVAKTEPRRS